MKSREVLETSTRNKNMKPVWKVKGFEKQTSWTVSVLDVQLYVYVHLKENVHVRHERDKRARREKTQHTTTHHIQEGHGFSCRLSALVLNFSPFRHSEHCTGIVSTPFGTIEKTLWNMEGASHSQPFKTIVKKTQRRRRLVAHPHHDNHYPSDLCFSLLCPSRNFVDNSTINSVDDDKGQTN